MKPTADKIADVLKLPERARSYFRRLIASLDDAVDPEAEERPHAVFTARMPRSRLGCHATALGRTIYFEPKSHSILPLLKHYGISH